MTLNVRYNTPPVKNLSIENGSVFTFIFERQSGSPTKLDLKIGAPLGYSWVESDSPVFEYKNDDPDARVILALTLKK